MSVSLPPPTEPFTDDNGKINDVWYRALWQKLSDVQTNLDNAAVRLTSGSASSAATVDVQLTTFGSYNTYRLYFEAVPTAAASLLCQYAQTSSVSTGNTAYQYFLEHKESTAGVSVAFSTGSSAATIVGSLTSLRTVKGVGEFFNPTTSVNPGSWWQGETVGSGYLNAYYSANSRTDTNTIDAVRFLPSAGSFSSFKYVLYGMP